MAEESEKSVPMTAGELRRRLAERGFAWTVDPRLGDDDTLPEYPRGGQPPEADETASLWALEGDLGEHVAEHPPTNPFLRARWSELGLLPREE
jgi:hypothetical protein